MDYCEKHYYYKKEWELEYIPKEVLETPETEIELVPILPHVTVYRDYLINCILKELKSPNSQTLKLMYLIQKGEYSFFIVRIKKSENEYESKIILNRESKNYCEFEQFRYTINNSIFDRLKSLGGLIIFPTQLYRIKDKNDNTINFLKINRGNKCICLTSYIEFDSIWEKEYFIFPYPDSVRQYKMMMQ